MNSNADLFMLSSTVADLAARLASVEQTVSDLQQAAMSAADGEDETNTWFPSPRYTFDGGGSSPGTGLRGAGQGRADEARGHVRVTSEPDSAVVARAYRHGDGEESDSDSDGELRLGVYYV